MFSENLEQAQNARYDREEQESQLQEEKQLLESFNKNSDIQDISQFLEGKVDQEFEDLYKKTLKEKIIGLLEVEYLKNPEFFDIQDSLKTVLYGEDNQLGNENAFMQRKGLALDNKDKLYNELSIVISKTHEEAYEDVYETESKKESHDYIETRGYDALYENLVSGDNELSDDISSENKKEYIEKNNDKEKNIKQAQDLIYNNEFIEQFFDKDIKSARNDLDFFENPEVQADLSSILSNFVISSEVSNLSEATDNDLKQINTALNASFDIQVAKLLHGKVNYPEKTVDKLIREIHNGNPFEKIEIYQELKQLVNNKEGFSGKAMEKGKKDITNRVQKKLLVKLEREKEELTLMLENNNLDLKDSKELKEEIKLLEDLIEKQGIVEGEVFAGNMQVEGENIGNETGSENI